MAFIIRIVRLFGIAQADYNIFLNGFLWRILGTAQQTGEQVAPFRDHDGVFAMCSNGKPVFGVPYTFYSHDHIAVGLVFDHYNNFFATGIVVE